VNGGGGQSYQFYLVNPDVGTHDVVIYPNQPATSYHAQFISFFGADQVNPINTSGTHAGVEAYSGEVYLTTTVDDCYLVDLLCMGASSNSQAADAGQTVIHFQASTGINAGGSYKQAGAAGSCYTGWTWYAAEAGNGMSTVAVAPSSGPGIQTAPFLLNLI
jgi:hypothetical protein